MSGTNGELRTVRQVLDALGKGDRSAGRQVLLQLTGKAQQNITNWLAAGRLPQWSFLIVTSHLARRGYRVHPKVFGMADIRKAS